MKDQDRTPRRDKDAFVCPRCNVWAHQEWHPLGVEEEDDLGNTWFSTWQDSNEPIPKYATAGRSWGAAPQRVEEWPAESEPIPEPQVEPADEASRGRWAASTCGHCDESTVWRDDRMVYPSASTAPVPHEEMPPGARELYVEAREVVGLSRRAGAALARASMERLLKALDPEAGTTTLEKRIERVLPRVSSSLGDLLTVIRHAGNKSLHVEDDPDELTVLVLDPGEEEVVDFMFTAINNLVDELITRPRKAAELYALVPQGVRDRVDKAKGATTS